MELVKDRQEGTAMEPLVAVAPYVKLPWRQALWDLADVEDSGHYQPEAVSEGYGEGYGEGLRRR